MSAADQLTSAMTIVESDGPLDESQLRGRVSFFLEDGTPFDPSNMLGDFASQAELAAVQSRLDTAIVIPKTTSFDVIGIHAGRTIEYTSGSAGVATLRPKDSGANNYPDGALIELFQAGAGTITLAAAAGVTAPPAATSNPGDSIFLRKRPGTDIWTAVSGGISFERNPVDMGLVAWTEQPGQFAGFTAPTTGVIYGIRAKVPLSTIFTGISGYSAGSAVAWDANQSFVGIADTNGVVLAKSAAGAVEASTIAAAGNWNVPISPISANTHKVAGSPTAEVILFMELHGTTLPAIGRINTTIPVVFLNMGGKGNYRHAPGPYTAIPSTIPFSANAGVAFWFGATGSYGG